MYFLDITATFINQIKLQYTKHVFDHCSRITLMFGMISVTSNMKELELFQNKCLRQCLNLHPDPVTYRKRNSELNIQSKVTTIKKFARKIKENFKRTCRNQLNDIIDNLFPPYTDV